MIGGATEHGLATMVSGLERRGPDDEGRWSSPDRRDQLGFRRLSVLDLTPGGRQPMISADGSAVLVFNGEIYNHRELGAELEDCGVVFRSRSDSEVLLELLARDGRAGLDRLNGMFALALWSPERRHLLLARDHAGIKPLYWCRSADGATTAFCSRYDLLFSTGLLDPDDVDPEALRCLLDIHHIPAPLALHHNAGQVEPGGWMEVDGHGAVSTGRWWELPEHPVGEMVGDDAVDLVGDAIDGAVARQRLADVDVGVFVSGGIDSPLVAATAAAQVSAPVDAFTIGTAGWKQNESPTATAVAQQLGLQHHVAETATFDLEALARDAAEAASEPLGDFSLFPTLMVSSLARSRVTVALSGDGGDELFFGYERPRSLLNGGNRFDWPMAARRGAYYAGRLHLIRPQSDVSLHADAGEWYLRAHSHTGPKVRDALLAGRSSLPGTPAFPAEIDIYRPPEANDYRSLADLARRTEFRGQLQRVLKKVDMASMHHGLEVRVPLLDREVIEASLALAPEANLAGGARKAILVQLLDRRLTPGTIPDVKRGFSVPMAQWLRGPLRTVLNDELVARPPAPPGLIDPTAVRVLVDEHLSGQINHHWVLYLLLSLRWWWDRAEVLAQGAREAAAS